MATCRTWYSVLVIHALVAVAQTPVHGDAQSQSGRSEPKKTERPVDACADQRPAAIRLFEVRAVDRIEEDLLLVDGINTNRDVLVVACYERLLERLRQHIDRGGPRKLSEWAVVVEVRAWHKPKEGGWREMRLNEPPVETAASLTAGGFTPDRWDVELVQLLIKTDTVVNPTATIPLRRDAVKPEDSVRIRVLTRLAAIESLRAGAVPPTAAGARDASASTAGGTSQPVPTPGSRPTPIVSENEELIDSIFEVGRFGLHIRFSDLIVFVQRLGEDDANTRPGQTVLFDVVNYRPAPGASYGFTFYDRRRAFLRFLEPGFGAHLVFLNWTDRTRLAPPDETQVTALQLGVGVTGSMFDGTVVAVLGSNLHVKDHRPYVGVGFSVTGMVRKLSRFLQD